MSNQPKIADALAETAIRPIVDGMIVGLGTGKTARRGIVVLAERVREEGLRVKCVATSERSEQVAKEHGLTAVDFSMIPRVDYLFDGADEVAPGIRVLKGAGGAMTRERMVAWAADRVVYMVTERKLVDRLGSSTTLPIAVMAFGLASIRADLHHLGLNGVLRRNLDGSMFITDNGNLILDVTLDEGHDVEEIATALNRIPGVIDHGLFLEEADEVLVEMDSGEIKTLAREA